MFQQSNQSLSTCKMPCANGSERAPGLAELMNPVGHFEVSLIEQFLAVMTGLLFQRPVQPIDVLLLVKGDQALVLFSDTVSKVGNYFRSDECVGCASM